MWGYFQVIQTISIQQSLTVSGQSMSCREHLTEKHYKNTYKRQFIDF